MRRILILFLAVLALFWVIGGMFRRLRASAPTSGPAPRDAAPAGPMVRDRVCNTFLPRSKALRLESGTEEHFFCSEACQDRFLAQKRGPAA